MDSGVRFEIECLLVVPGRTLVIAGRCEDIGVLSMDDCVVRALVEYQLEVMSGSRVLVRLGERACVIESRRWIVELCWVRLSSVSPIRGPTPESVGELFEFRKHLSPQTNADSTM